MAEDEDYLDEAPEAPEEEAEETTSEGPEDDGLKKQLEDTKRKLHEIAMENAELRGRQSALETKSEEEVEASPFESLQEDDVIQNPYMIVSATQDALAKFRQEVIETFKARDQFLAAEMDKRDPALAAVREQIDELRKDPDLKGLSDRQLAAIAKRTTANDDTEERSLGRPGGKRSARGGTRSTKSDPKSNPLFREIYADRFPEMFKGGE